MDDMMDFLESSPLVGLQVDGTHLRNVLQRLLQEQQQQANFQRQMGQRLVEMEAELRGLGVRQKDVEKALGGFGPESMRAVREELDAVGRGVDNLARELRDARQMSADAVESAAGARRELLGVGREVTAVRERQERLHQDVGDLAEEMGRQNRQISDAVSSIEREQALQAEQTRNLARDLEQGGVRENLQRLRELFNELCDRTDKNFRNIEESARAVDTELNSQRTDISALQESLVSIQEKVRQSLSSVVKDVDSKCQLIIDTLHEHEKSSLELEEHMVAAGQALARRQALKQQRGISGSRGYDAMGTHRNGW